MWFRLVADDGKIVAVDLFSNSPNLFNVHVARQAAVLASFATVAIKAVAHGQDAVTLRRGLHSNRKIGKAVGMLMLLHHVSEDEAFNMLRRHSQELNIKLADVASMVIERRGQLPVGRDA
jgi:hypothetical protein